MDEHRQTPPSNDSTSGSSASISDPSAALENLREKMEEVATEFSRGKINRAQFNAVYGRYNEQRTIIERLIERDPSSESWKQVAAAGHTGFLRRHFESRALYYLIYKREQYTPLMGGGKTKPDPQRMGKILRTLWGMKNQRRAGVARMTFDNDQWMILALGDYSVTLVMFALEPSIVQIQRVRDLHADFERANYFALERSLPVGRMVFPQRALVE